MINEKGLSRAWIHGLIPAFRHHHSRSITHYYSCGRSRLLPNLFCLLACLLSPVCLSEHLTMVVVVLKTLPTFSCSPLSFALCCCALLACVCVCLCGLLIRLLLMLLMMLLMFFPPKTTISWSVFLFFGFFKFQRPFGEEKAFGKGQSDDVTSQTKLTSAEFTSRHTATPRRLHSDIAAMPQ